MQTETTSDDLALVRAIASTGTLAEAARRLGVNHATAFRHLNRIESRLGVQLFDRARAGYILTAAGELAMEHAQKVADELAAFENKVAGTDRTPSGTVRLATTDTLLAGLLGPVLGNFRKIYPMIDLEVVTSNTVVDLGRREADLAVRPSRKPPDSLLGRRICKIELAIYAKRGLADGVDPLTSSDVAWIGPDESFGDPSFSGWFASNKLERLVTMRTNTLMGMLALATSGNGLSVLPTYLGDPVPSLERLSAPIPELAVDLWLLRHPALRDTVRIKVLADFLAHNLATEAV